MSSKFDDFVRVKDRFPYHGKGIEELIQSLKRLLSLPENKYTQKVILEVGTPYIYFEKLVPPDEAGKVPKTQIKDSIRNTSMEEYEPSEEETPVAQLYSMFNIVKKEGLEVGFIGIGNKQTFQKWLGVRIPTTNMQLFGVPLEVIDDMPDHVFIVCGTETRVAEAEDIKYSIKGNINEANNKETPRSGTNK